MNVLGEGSAPAVSPDGQMIYFGNDVLAEARSEDELAIHFWDGSGWLALKSEVATTFNLASARSQGPGCMPCWRE